MLIRVRMKRVEMKTRTTRCEPCDTDMLAPLDNFYPDTELLDSLPFNTDEFILSIADRPFAEREVAIAFPPLPFVRMTKNKCRFEILNDRGRRLRTSSEYPITQAFMNNELMDARIMVERRPIYFGISEVPQAVTEDEGQATADDLDAGKEESGGADAIAAFDDFLRETVRVAKGGRITSRQIWAVWAARCGANPDDEVGGGVRFTDVARRFRSVFRATAVKTPTRIDGRLQRYWLDYTI